MNNKSEWKRHKQDNKYRLIIAGVIMAILLFTWLYIFKTIADILFI